jgi:ABC-2 type transport system ATP-binding protein
MSGIPAPSEPVIRVRGLRKSYGDLEAVRGIDLEVAAGEIFAFLGPNGAGKTTTVEILEGYRPRDGGEVSVLGADPASPSRDWRERVGLVLQECRLTPELTVREAVDQYAGYYSHPRDPSEVIDLVGLSEKGEVRTGKLSGGQQRRLDVALSLVGDPELLFLDEPTTGFDPSARRQAWEVIASLRELGKTVFLTTHYMEEAQALADRVAILVRGEVVLTGRPGELNGPGASVTSISFRMPRGIPVEALPAKVRTLVGTNEVGVSLRTGEPTEILQILTTWAVERGVQLPGLEVHGPTLEDIYLEVTG